MMKVIFPILVQDQQTVHAENLSSPIEGQTVIREYFGAGPVCDEVEIRDYEDIDNSNKLSPDTPIKKFNNGDSARYTNQEGVPLRNYYKLGLSLSDPDFMKVSTLGLVLNTMDMMISEKVLGRKINWAFGKKKLQIHTRGIFEKNAFYNRKLGAIHLGFFPKDGDIIYACLSRDIITHEVGHAMIDALCPQLNAAHPEGLAIHEALSDMIAVLSALNNSALQKLALDDQGDIHPDLGHFSKIAEEFSEKRNGFRNLQEPWHLNDNDQSFFAGNFTNPHDLSLVLSGALMTVLETKQHINKEFIYKKYENIANYRQAGRRSIGEIVYRFTRLISRSLDWSPPGEINFESYYHSLIAVIRRDMKEPQHLLDLINEEFLDRGMITTSNYPTLDLKISKKEVGQLFKSSRFTKTKIKILNKILSRNQLEEIVLDLDILSDMQITTSKPFNNKRYHNEGFIKAGWVEKIKIQSRRKSVPDYIFVDIGYSFVFDLKKKKLFSLLTNSNAARSKRDIKIRSTYINELIKNKRLLIGTESNDTISAKVEDNALRLENSCSLLHVC